MINLFVFLSDCLVFSVYNYRYDVEDIVGDDLCDGCCGICCVKWYYVWGSVWVGFFWVCLGGMEFDCLWMGM